MFLNLTQLSEFKLGRLTHGFLELFIVQFDQTILASFALINWFEFRLLSLRHCDDHLAILIFDFSVEEQLLIFLVYPVDFQFFGLCECSLSRCHCGEI